MTSTTQRKKTRSPSYPSIDLSAAIRRAKELYAKEGRHNAAIAAVAEDWGYSPSSSGFLQTISALKQYGLIEDEGSKQDRQIQITGLGHDLVLDDSSQWRTAVKTAALNPQLHGELWEKYGANLPSMGTIRHYLERERGFNSKVVEGFVKNFQETIEFSGLTDEDYEEATKSPTSDQEQETPPPSIAPGSTPQMNVTQSIAPNTLPLPIMMDDGSFQIVPIPKMTRAAFEFFKKQLEVYRKAIVKEENAESNPQEQNEQRVEE